MFLASRTPDRIVQRSSLVTDRPLFDLVITTSLFGKFNNCNVATKVHSSTVSITVTPFAANHNCIGSTTSGATTTQFSVTGGTNGVVQTTTLIQVVASTTTGTTVL